MPHGVNSVAWALRVAGIVAERFGGQAAVPGVMVFTGGYLAAWLALTWMGLA